MNAPDIFGPSNAPSQNIQCKNVFEHFSIVKVFGEWLASFAVSSAVSGLFIIYFTEEQMMTTKRGRRSLYRFHTYVPRYIKENVY